jgi:glycosyltransferase involved in cell wall biosynthesis
MANDGQFYGRALWVSTSLSSLGGMTTFVQTLKDSPLASMWKIDFIATHRAGSILTRFLTFVRGLLLFVLSLMFRRPDVVHLHTAKYGSFARKGTLVWLARAARVPVVLHIHAGEFCLFYDRMPRVGQWAIRATLLRANVVIALGDYWSTQLRTIAPRADIRQISNAIPIVGRTRRRPDGRVNVVFLGKIGDAKGTFTLLDAWAKLVAEYGRPPAQLTIAGSGEISRARETIDRLGLSDSAQVLSWLPAAEVAKLLMRTDVLTLPSRNEGQPMAILEAMARGLCVVASSVGGIPELIEDGRSGLLVPPDNVHALSTALGHVIDDQDLRDRLGDAALTRARQHFNVEVVWRRFNQLYRELTETTEPIAQRSA